MKEYEEYRFLLEINREHSRQMLSMFRKDTKGYKPTITNIVEETTRNKRRERVKPLVRVMEDDTYTGRHTHARTLKIYLAATKKNVVIHTAIFYMAPKIFLG
jgi:hypothetical protein